MSGTCTSTSCAVVDVAELGAAATTGSASCFGAASTSACGAATSVAAAV